MAFPKTTLALAAMSGAVAWPAGATQLPGFAGEISAGTIAVISDGDFVAQTYATGELAPREARHRDLLTILSIQGREVSTTGIPVSNSVTATPEILELSRDGRTAF